MVAAAAMAAAVTEAGGRIDDSPVVVFDATCLLCSRWVAFLLAHDRKGRIRFAAMQGHHGQALLQQHGLDPADPTSFLWVENERGYRNSDAILRLIAGLGGAWRMLTVLRVIPRSLRDAAYRLIARNRYRWFGRSERCLVPDAAVRQRFLD